MRPVIRLLSLTLATVLLASVLAGGAHAAQGDTAFVARPADGAPTSPEGGWFLFPSAQPGQELTSEVALRNDGDAPLALRLAAVDATTAQLGGVEYGLPDAPAERTGAWVRLARDTVDLAPGGSAVVPFTVAVPVGADPGDHLAGVAVWAPGQSDESQDTAGMAPGVVIETRQVIAVQLEVPGPAPRRLEIEGVDVAARPDGAYLEVLIANTGRRLERGQGRLTVDGQPVAASFPIDTVVPGTAVAYPLRWEGADLGRAHDVEVTIAYEGGEAAWQGTVAPDVDVRQALEDWDAPGESGGGDRGAILLLLAGLVAALVTLLSLVRWRRARRPAPAERVDARQLDSSRSS